MDKILVEVYVPLLDHVYDIFIPRHLPMYQVLELIKKAVTELSDGRFVADSTTAICYRDNGNIININMRVYELEIYNGSKLMLI